MFLIILYRLLDRFAESQIEWKIIRLGTSMPFDKKMRKEPAYAPFVAAGFYFIEGSTNHNSFMIKIILNWNDQYMN